MEFLLKFVGISKSKVAIFSSEWKVTSAWTLKLGDWVTIATTFYSSRSSSSDKFNTINPTLHSSSIFIFIKSPNRSINNNQTKSVSNQIKFGERNNNNIIRIEQH
ncbi:hypothetical protein PPL_06723 [Heterostelium album PN500]|uniref:Uncharacterized protein n=1 Tax=Heterostelium pallidum (strain ATCC 26659 / Pp 5 / PN500) TaxID=670386 RepID=D3BFI9_HETP5|nr:hypothetical protein PPL_06723 [Heterostelium album PN500]EFA79903.1 hypothetical protein PPL_06723 [Heterostelium album PN500]|eukprot:XP_020432024.1 hypothetical protein PPL_06723 [Heterostelium album PN500]